MSDHERLPRFHARRSSRGSAGFAGYRFPAEVILLAVRYVKIAGVWRYVYRAVDENGQVIDVFVSKKRDTVAATRIFRTAIISHGGPRRGDH